MSSVLIKGLRMPIEDEIIIRIQPNGAILDQCGHRLLQKAIQVPPHGRLGDLDKLENGLRHMAKYQHGERQQGILGCCETIRLAPTVIEAEGTKL